MRVLYVSTVERGGTLTHLRDLAPAVAAAGADVTVLCHDPGGAALFAGHGVHVEVVPVDTKWSVHRLGALDRLVRRSDVVHSHDRRAHLFGLPLARRHGKVALRTFHGLPDEIASIVDGDPAKARVLPRGTRRRVFGVTLRAEDVLGRVAQHTIVPSRPLAAFLMARGADPARLSVIPSGIDVPAWRARPRGAATLEVATAAVLEGRKGIDVLLRALSGLDAPLRLRIWGDGSRRRDLEALARALHVDVSFEGHVSDVRSAMRSCDLFVLPSLGENLPIVLLEAMSIGLPVIATGVGGVPTLVLDGRTGLLVPPGDVEALAGALGRLARDASLRDALGRRARDHVAATHAIGDIAGRVLDLYARLCASSTPSRS